MSDTPFELRAGLLGQAEQILSHQYHSELERLRYLIDRNMISPKDVEWPACPSSEDIIAEAQKLYEFVKTK